MRPMLATRGTEIPLGQDWLHEIKWDGMRTIATLSPHRAELRSRLDNDVSVSFPELQALSGALGRHRSAVIDGEIVALDNGSPSFQALTERMHVGRPDRAARLAVTRPVTLLIFDLLELDGVALIGEPLSVRREILEGLGLAGPNWQTPPCYSDGPELAEAARAQSLEGVVSKRLDSRYEPGVRSPNWLKFPHRDTSSWVVGGWRLQTESASTLGALLVGEPTADGLLYRGRVGSGINSTLAVVLKNVLSGLAVPAAPFADIVPREDSVGSLWVEPLLVVDVESLGVSRLGRLRQPSFRGVRPDLSPDDLVVGDDSGRTEW